MQPGVSELRDDARRAFEAAVTAVQPGRLLPPALSRLSLDVPRGGRLVVAALGKAGPGLAASWRDHRPAAEDQLLVIAPHGTPISKEIQEHSEVHFGAHPLPDRAGEDGARRLYDLAEGLGANDHLLVLLSGGASALLALPTPGLSLADLNTTTNALLRAGATITELNTIRREILVLTGGGLSRAAWPARVTSLVLSDVPGGALEDIASGPTLPSPTGPREALAILNDLGLMPRLPTALPEVLQRLLLHRADDGSWIEHTRTLLLGCNRTAVDAAAAFLRQEGYRPTVEAEPLVGEASIRGWQLADLARDLALGDRRAVVFGGETTVTVTGGGIGGRNSELCLAAALAMEGAGSCMVLSAGTDGIDGTSSGAGAMVDPQSADRIRSAGLDPVRLLEDNDSATALAASGDAIVTGPTGTNVSDVMLVIGGCRTPREISEK